MATGRRVRWGVLGAANIVRRRFALGVNRSERAEIVGVGSRDLARARALADEVGAAHACGTYEEVLANPDVDAVYIPLPNGLHPEWVVKTAAAGKHVLCEKPLARSAADAERARDACRAAGVLLVEGFMYRHHPQHARVQELLREGVIGEPSILRAAFGFRMYPERRAAGDVRLSVDLQGGALMDVGCYPVNLARFLYAAEPEAVSAQQRLDPEFGVDTRFAAVLRFPGDRLAVIDTSFDSAGANRYEIGGTLGRIRVEQGFRTDGEVMTVDVEAERTWQETFPYVDQFALQIDHFAACLDAGRLLPPAEDGVAQARTIEALYLSAETGQTVRVEAA